MKSIPAMKLFSKEELYCLLNDCSETLAQAFLESHDGKFWDIALQAKLACEALGFEIKADKKNTTLH